LGVTGPLKGKRLSENMKMEIFKIIEDAHKKGIPEKRACELLQILCRRVRSWKGKGSFQDGKPGPLNAPHRLLEKEREAILTMAKEEEYIDDSHRVLAAKASDNDKFCASASSVYRVLKKEGLTMDRCGKNHRNGNSKKPDRPELTGPNQRWCWDISYLPTNVKGTFLYLYVLLDEYSRKIVAWRVSWNLKHQEGMELIEEGLENEGLEKGEVELPDLYNDRGIQMKAKRFVKMLQDLGMNQVFSRPRTPNDNPFVESVFSTIKEAPVYPGQFVDLDDAIIYFTQYIDWYNNVRLHGKIGYVTPVQKHTGQDKEIISKRKRKLVIARNERLSKNRERTGSVMVSNVMS
jgi:putative transposase